MSILNQIEEKGDISEQLLLDNEGYYIGCEDAERTPIDLRDNYRDFFINYFQPIFA